MQNGELAQLARASGSYPAGRWFKSDIRYHQNAMGVIRFRCVLLYGALVKRLRHGPFTAVTWVRFPYGSPRKDTDTPKWVSVSFLCSAQNRTHLRYAYTCRFAENYERARGSHTSPRSARGIAVARRCSNRFALKAKFYQLFRPAHRILVLVWRSGCYLHQLRLLY